MTRSPKTLSARSTRPTRFTLAGALAVALTVSSPPAGAQSADNLRLPIDIDAESTRYDGNAAVVEFTGLKLTQGNISIEADLARTARTADFNDSTWQFTGNVVFDVDQGHIECDEADLHFAEFELELAVIEGNPATFEFRRPGAKESTYAEASKLRYDVTGGVIEFSGDAVITEGGNRIASETLVYDINERRINAVADNPDDPVKLRYTPPPSTEDAGEAADETVEDDAPPDGDGAE